MKNLKLLPPIMLLSLLTTNAYGLVDYTESSSAPEVPAARNAPPAAAATMIRREAPTRSSASNGPAAFQLAAGYESLSFNLDGEDSKLGFTKIHAHFQTNYDIFMAASFWRATTDSALLSESSDSQNGNPQAIIGFNWLRFGAAQEMATIDLYGGGSFRGNSDLASSRSDTIAGVETSKRFYDFFLGLGYEMRLTGAARNNDERDIGNIQKLSASLGWRATPDIQFIVEGSSVTVAPGDETKSMFLKDKQSFASITPKLGLFLRPVFQLELGARFQTKAANNPEALVDARLWDLSGAYGNSLFANINFSL